MSWMGSSVPALVRGSLAVRPFGKLILLLYRRSVTGRLVVVDDDGDRTTIFLRRGIPVFVERPSHEDRLDKVLLETGAISSERLVEAERMRAETGRRLGVLLEELGILDHEAVAAALREQTARKLRRLFIADRGVFEVFVHDHPFALGDELDELRTEPLAVVLDAIRNTYDDDRLQKDLADLEAYRFVLMDKLPLPRKDVEFLLGDDELLARLRSSGLTLTELRQGNGAKRESVVRTVALHFAGALGVRADEPLPPPAPRASAASTRVPASASASASAPASASASAPASASASAPASASASASAPDDDGPKATLLGLGSGGATPDADATDSVSRKTPVAKPFTRRLARASGTEEIQLPRAAGAPPAGAGRDSPVRQTPSGPSAMPVPERPADSGPTTYKIPSVDRLSGVFGPERTSGGFTAAQTSGGFTVERTSGGFTVDRTGGGFSSEPTSGGKTGSFAEPTSGGKTGSFAAEAPKTTADATPPPVADTPPPVATDNPRRQADADLAFQKGSALLKARDLARAEDHFARAVDLDPGKLQYQTLLAWVRFSRAPVAERPAAAEAALMVMAPIFKQLPEWGRGLYYVGCMFKETGDAARAEKSFRLAAKADPSLVAAARELRLIELRKAPTKGKK